MVKSFTFIFAALLIVSCGENRKATEEPAAALEEADFFVFDMEQELARGARARTLNELIDTATYIPLETHKDALLPFRCELARVGSDFFIGGGPVGRLSPIYRFDSLGRFAEQMTTGGRGPNEPTMPLKWYANAPLGRINVIDMAQKMVFVNTANGERSQAEIDLAHELDRVPLADSTFVSTDRSSLYFTDSDGKLVHSIAHTGDHVNHSYESRENETVRPHESYWLSPDYTGDAILAGIFNDTLRRVRSRHEITPHLVFRRGALSPLPEDTYNEKNLRQAHFTYVKESGDHVFLNYEYEGETWCDVWSKSGGELLLHAPRQGRGYPFHLLVPFAPPDGDVIEVKVAYADHERVYCLMEALDACRFMPNVKEDDNPVIVIAKLKK